MTILIAFLTTISKPIGYRTAEFLKSQTVKDDVLQIVHMIFHCLTFQELCRMTFSKLCIWSFTMNEYDGAVAGYIFNLTSRWVTDSCNGQTWDWLANQWTPDPEAEPVLLHYIRNCIVTDRKLKFFDISESEMFRQRSLIQRMRAFSTTMKAAPPGRWFNSSSRSRPG